MAGKTLPSPCILIGAILPLTHYFLRILPNGNTLAGGTIKRRSIEPGLQASRRNHTRCCIFNCRMKTMPE